MGITAERCRPGGSLVNSFANLFSNSLEKVIKTTVRRPEPRTQHPEPCISSVTVPWHEIHAANRCDHIRDQRAFHHARHRLQVAETRTAHVYPIWLRGAVAHHVIAYFAARRFDHLVHLARRHAETLRHNLEMVDERLHLDRKSTRLNS